MDPVALDVVFSLEIPVGDALVVVVVVVGSELLLSDASEDDSRKSFVKSIGLEDTFLGRDFFREIGSVILLPKSPFKILSMLNFRPA